MAGVIGNLYSIPAEFFSNAHIPGEDGTVQCLATTSDACSDLVASTQQLSLGHDDAHDHRSSNGATCIACSIGTDLPPFSSAAEQRAHFKADWHRFNVKRRLLKQPPVTEEQFETLLEQASEVSSISGSESESDQFDEEDEDDQGFGPARGGAGASSSGRQHLGAAAHNIPQAVFVSEGQGGAKPFAVWRALLMREAVKGQDDPSPQQLLGELQRLRACRGTFLVVLLRGGHFAAAVFRAQQQQQHKAGQQQQQQQGGGAAAPFEVVAHKTFHRYVVRAKAGGKQSSKDASGKFARSAGSQLRRYNEAALDAEIAELFHSWRSHLDAADLMFIHAPASNARTIFSTGSGVAGGSTAAAPPITPSDPRVRRIPFATQRPTFSETQRVMRLLTSVFEPRAAAAAVAQARAAPQGGAAQEKVDAGPPEPAADSQQPGSSDDEDAGEGEDQVASTSGRKVDQTAGDTPLHTASRKGDAAAVQRLLSTGADPAALNARGRTPYALAATKDVRDAFRRHMAAQPDAWDWAAAGVPSALTADMEASQAAKKAEKKARAKARDAERKAVSAEAKQKAAEEARAAEMAALDAEIARAAAEAATLSARTGGASKPGSKVGAAGGGAGGRAPAASAGRGGSGAAAGRGGRGGRGQQQQAAAQQVPPSAEEMARRREQLAAAAEARMKALQQAAGQQKLW